MFILYIMEMQIKNDLRHYKLSRSTLVLMTCSACSLVNLVTPRSSRVAAAWPGRSFNESRVRKRVPMG